MKVVYRDLVKHSTVYGLAQVIGRIGSLLLLPVYTNYLKPADYGCIAIIDLTVGMLVLLVGPGIATAVSRFHFEARGEAEVGRVWWTGLTLVAALGLALLAPAWLLRGELARLMLGPGLTQGRYYFSLALPMLWLSVVGELPTAYLRVRKWSGVFLAISVARLLLNIAMNVYFLVALRMGVAAILLGNLLTACVVTPGLLVLLAGGLGRYAFDPPLARKLAGFAAPMAVTALMSMTMHNTDRYLLRFFLNMEEVGIYSFAYTIGQGVNTLLLMPFLSIWGVAIYELAGQPDAKQVYTRVFEYFVYGLALVMLGVSLFARPLLRLVASDDYAGAAELVPVVCLAYVLYSLHNHFQVPALLAKRTVSLLPASILAASANIALNLVAIPLWGAAGAAWVSVLTFAIYSFVGLWRYRLIDRYDYPLARCGAVLIALIATYISCRSLGLTRPDSGWMLTIPVAAWTALAGLLFGPLALQFARRYRAPSRLPAPADGVLGDRIV